LSPPHAANANSDDAIARIGRVLVMASTN
jgi:hypothetical protein